MRSSNGTSSLMDKHYRSLHQAGDEFYILYPKISKNMFVHSYFFDI